MIVGQTGLALHLLAVEPAQRFAEGIELGSERLENFLRPPRRDRGVVFAAPRPVALDPVSGDLLLQITDGRSAKSYMTLRALQFL